MPRLLGLVFVLLSASLTEAACPGGVCPLPNARPAPSVQMRPLYAQPPQVASYRYVERRTVRLKLFKRRSACN